MARIAGVDIPNKHVGTALTYIYGIGRSSAAKICEEAKIDPMKMANDLTQDELAKIREIIDANYKTEGRLRSEIGLNLKRLMDIGCYRGLRHPFHNRNAIVIHYGSSWMFITPTRPR